MYNKLVGFEHMGSERTSEGNDLLEVSLLRLFIKKCSLLCVEGSRKGPAVQRDPDTQEPGLFPAPHTVSSTLPSAQNS